MKTSYDRKTSGGVVRRASLVGCMVLAGVALVLGLYPAQTTAQPGPKDKSEGAAGKRLNHIDLVVPNVKENRAFFEKYFGFRCVVNRDDKLVVMTDGAGFALTLSSPEMGAEIDQFQNDPGKTAPKDKEPASPDAKKPIEYPKGFHIGFRQDSREQVDEIYKQLKSGGVTVEKPREYHGAWTFFVRAPGGYFIEVFHQPRRGDGQ